MSAKTVPIVFKPNKLGSVEHYYHYVLGFLLPLALFLHNRPEIKKGQVRSCGPFDKITHEVFGDKLEIVDKEVLNAMDQNGVATLFGLDLPGTNDASKVIRMRNIIRAREIILREMGVGGNTRPRPTNENPHVLFINRLPPDEFYSSETSEIKGSGADRRSIPNSQDIAGALLKAYRCTSCIALEGASLNWQMNMFNAADIIVAQHGASLVNLLWCRPGTTVLEIVPVQRIHAMRKVNIDFFGYLSMVFGLKHKRILQSSNHVAVDPEQIFSALQK